MATTATQSDRIPGPVNDADWTSTALTSSNGTQYQVRVPKGEDVAAAAAVSNAFKAAGSAIFVDVHWVVTGDVWVYLPADIADKLKITRYSLHVDHGSPIFDWELEFTNTAAGEWRFYDEEGDYYDVAASKLKDHLVDYNSKQPTIIKVRYTPA